MYDKICSPDYQVVAELLEKASKVTAIVMKYTKPALWLMAARAASLLAGKYHWVITSVPYFTAEAGRGLAIVLRCQLSGWQERFGQRVLERCLQFLVPGGTMSIVMPHNWLFLTSYKRFREKLLENDTWHMIARLGATAFQTPMWILMSSYSP